MFHPNHNEADLTSQQGETLRENSENGATAGRVRSVAFRYGLAAAACAVTITVSALLQQSSVKLNLAILVIIAIIIPAWYGGRGPGLLVCFVFEAVSIFSRPISPEISIAQYLFSHFSILAVYVVLVLLVSSRRNAENNLRESEKRYRHLFENNPFPMWVYDLETLRFLAVNDAAVDSYGYSQDEFLAMTIEEITPRDNIPALLEDLTKPTAIVATREGLKHRKKDGTVIDVEITSHELVFDGRDSRLVLANDITHRKRALESVRELNETLEQRVVERTAQLEAATRRESMIIENALDVICTIDAEGKFVTVSPACFRIWGYKPEELVGRHYIELVAPADVPKTNEAALNIMSGVNTKDFENRYQHKNGSLVNTMWAAYWSHSEQLMFCVGRDITERKKMEEIHAKFAAIIASSDDAIISKTLDGIITSWNLGAEKMFGYSTQEAIGQPMTMLIPPERIDEEPEFLTRIARGESVEHFETVRLRKDGKQINISATISPIKDSSGKVIGASKIARDVTERKLSDDRIKQLNENLAKQAASLEAANKELEAFSYSVSHDLRAPLRAIDGFSRIFIEDHAEKLDDEGRRVLDVIRTNAQNMGTLIDDLLAFSRLGRTQIEPSVIDMNELARVASREVRSAFESKSVHFNISHMPDASGDSALMRQVFINLCSNAVKYSGAKDYIEVEIGSKTESDECIYYVRDQGVGFDMRYSNKLFGVFQRLHSPEEFEGTGVGLAIVQRIVHRHGGRVWAEGEVDNGATFYFALPRTGDDHYA